MRLNTRLGLVLSGLYLTGMMGTGFAQSTAVSSTAPGSHLGSGAGSTTKKAVVKKNPRPARNFDFGLNPAPAPAPMTDPHFLSLLQAPWLKQLAQGKTNALAKPAATPKSAALKRSAWAARPLNAPAPDAATGH